MSAKAAAAPARRRLDARRQAELVGGPAGGSRRPRDRAAAAAAAAPARRTPTSTATSAASRIPADHRHLLHLVERRILCACETLLALRGGDPDLRPTGTRTLWLDGLRAPRRGLGVVRDPDRARVLLRTRAPPARVVALYPSPAGATESELDLDAWARAAQRRTRCSGARARRRGADRQPHGRAAPARDRADRRVLPAGRPDQGRTGRGSPAAPGRERAIAAFFAELRAANGPA